MSKTVSKFAFTAGLVLAMVFTFSCSGGGGGGGDGDAITYTGTANGVTYTLEIEDGSYTLTQTADTKRSTGTVTKNVGGVLTLSPKEDPDDEFTATVSGNGITAMSGTITWDDGTANIAPNTLTPSGGIDPGTGGNPSIKKESFTDSRDGKSYSSVKIGTQTWMAENLHYDVPDDTTDVCYENSADSCAKYGRLYYWATAMGGASSSDKVPSGVQGVCPSGWHLPSNAEWTALTVAVTDAVGVALLAGKKLKSTSGWNSNGNGTDDYGFAALPGGYGASNGYFSDAGGSGNWWSSTEDGAARAWFLNLSFNYEYVGKFGLDKARLFSVRCVQD